MTIRKLQVNRHRSDIFDDNDFEQEEKTMDYDKIVLNVPHSSLLGLYDPEYSGWKENPVFECDCVLKWTDWATDRIFAPNHNLKVNVDMHIFQLSRFIIDAERLEHDPLDAKGQGIIYTDFDGFHREVSPDKKEFLMSIYHNYIRGVKENLTPKAFSLIVIPSLQSFQMWMYVLDSMKTGQSQSQKQST